METFINRSGLTTGTIEGLQALGAINNINTTMKKLKRIVPFVIVVLTMTMTNCRKDVSLPSSEFEKLFGQWEWQNSSGGYGGVTLTPATTGHNKTIEFEKNGIYKYYEDGKRKEKSKYSFSEGTSIYSNESPIFINFTKTGLLDFHNTSHSTMVEFGGQDTLILSDNMYDGYCSMYVRK